LTAQQIREASLGFPAAPDPTAASAQLMEPPEHLALISEALVLEEPGLDPPG